MKKLITLSILAFSASFSNAQNMYTVAGNGTASFGGDGGLGGAAELNLPYGVATDTKGDVYVADSYNNRIRMINTSGVISTVAGNGTGGYSGDGGQATAAEVNRPLYVTVDKSGNLYISDYDNNRIRMVNTSGVISTVAGNGIGGYSGDGSAATAAGISLPGGVAVDNAGNLYIAQYYNDAIRMVNTSGIISTIAYDKYIGYNKYHSG
jgi:sugar lactone lactonase YvrE